MSETHSLKSGTVKDMLMFYKLIRAILKRILHFTDIVFSLVSKVIVMISTIMHKHFIHMKCWFGFLCICVLTHTNVITYTDDKTLKICGSCVKFEVSSV